MSQYYYVTSSNQQAGPYDLNALVAQGITPQTLVWKEGLSGWVPAAQVPEVAAALRQQSAPGGGQVPPPVSAGKPTDMLVWAILSTVLCCVPLGVFAIVFAAKSRAAVARGDMELAQQLSKRSIIFTIIAAGVGFIGCIIVFIAGMLG